jgi:hypothetical protein
MLRYISEETAFTETCVNVRSLFACANVPTKTGE